MKKYKRYHDKLNAIARNKRERKIVDKYYVEAIERFAAGESREAIKQDIIDREMSTLGPVALWLLGWLIRKFIELMIDYTFSEMKSEGLV